MHVPYFSLVNLIAGHAIVPELMGGMFTRIHLIAALEPLLSDTSDRADMLQGYKVVQAKLGEPGASERTAAIIFNSLLH
jgi:lipid-A-disaccharide synthase